jgi:hypothetical protein
LHRSGAGAILYLRQASGQIGKRSPDGGAATRKCGQQESTVKHGLKERKGNEMMTTTLSRMLEEVKRLTPNEQRQLREAIDRILSSVPGAHRPIRARKPIKVRGKPLSETIIEERR